MEKSPIPDYKLDHGFLKEWAFEVLQVNEELKECGMEVFKTTQLPVYVQVTWINNDVDEWSYFSVSDGEFHLEGCVFVSPQPMPEQFSILKITNISKLPKIPLDGSSYIDGRYIRPVRLGEIKFDVEVTGDKIGCTLFREDKPINIEEIIEVRKKNGLNGLLNLAKSFEPSPNDRLTKYLWENRSEKFCDVKFTFENEPGVLIYAHKSVLMAVSDVSKAHFENEGFTDDKSVHLVDTNFYSFNKFLEFAYTGKVQFTNWKLAFELLYLSKKYLTRELENLCHGVIINFCELNGGNLLKVFHENRKVNDESIKGFIEDYSICRFSQIRDIINSVDFLNCDFSTIQWILSLDHLRIDEWSLLCAAYKWACHNSCHAFCHMVEQGTDQSHNMECLHEILECIKFERIDMMSLIRFFKIPKLAEIVNVGELREHIFDGLLENPSYFEQYGMATNGYSKFRSSTSYSDQSVCAEILIRNLRESQTTNLKDMRLYDGPVLGFIVKVEPKNNAAEDHSLDLVISFEYLYSLYHEDDGDMHITFRALPYQSRVKERVQVMWEEMELRKGERHEVKLHLKDSRRYLSKKIEEFGIETVGDSKKDRVLSLKILVRHNPNN